MMKSSLMIWALQRVARLKRIWHNGIAPKDAVDGVDEQHAVPKSLPSSKVTKGKMILMVDSLLGSSEGQDANTMKGET